MTDSSRDQNRYRRSLLRQERSQRTRRELIRAAIRLWSERGFDGATVEEICTAAGVGRTTFYLHFESKERLLVEITYETSGGVASDVREAVAASGDLEDQLSAFIDGLARRMDSVPKSLATLIIRSAVSGVGRRPPGGRLFDDTLGEIFLYAQDRGEIAPEVDTAELGLIGGGMTMEALRHWATGSEIVTDLRRALRVRFELLLDGVRV